MNNQHPTSAFDSALHLYDEAYRQHYERGNLGQACSLYREIIRNFPDSFESVYAVIQLEKIGMREAVKQLSAGGWVKSVAVTALVLSIIAFILAASSFVSTFLLSELFLRKQCITEVSNGESAVVGESQGCL